MAFVPLRRRWTKQPQQPATVNRSNSFGSRCTGLWTNAQGELLYDSAGTNNGINTNGPVIRAGSYNGAPCKYLQFDGSNDYTDLGAFSQYVPSTSSNFTVVQLVREVEAQDSFSLCTRSGSSAQGVDLLVHNGGTPGSWDARYGISGSTSNSIGAQSGFNDGQFHLAVISMDLVGGNAAFYVDNTNNKTTDTFAAGASMTHTQDFYLCRRSTLYGGHDVALTAVFDFAFTDGDMARLSQNIWQILQPQTQYIEIGAAAAGATFQPVWAFNSTVVQSMQGFS